MSTDSGDSAGQRLAVADIQGVVAVCDAALPLSNGDEHPFERLPRTVLAHVLEALVAAATPGNVVSLALVRGSKGGRPPRRRRVSFGQQRAAGCGVGRHSHDSRRAPAPSPAHAAAPRALRGSPDVSLATCGVRGRRRAVAAPVHGARVAAAGRRGPV